MWGALISTFFSSVCNVLWKKSLNISKALHASMYVFGLLGMAGSLLVVVFYLLTGMVDLSQLQLSWQFLLIMMTVSGLAVVFRPLNQVLFQNTEMTVLMPYTNLNKVFSVIASFLIYRDVSQLSLWITLLTIAVIIYFSIDFKTFKVPKTFGLILLVQGLISARYLLMSRVILELGDRVFFVYDIVLYTLALVVIIWFNHQGGQIRAFPASFYKFRFGAAFTGVIGTVISLYLIAELGATVVLLLGFLQVALIMIMATLYLGEHPTRRDILMTIIVTALVGIGFYFK